MEKEKGGEKTRKRGISAERIARRIIEGKGFSIIATNYKINSKGENIAEIDIVAEKDNEKYAIEVKSGRANLTTVRQAYANAKLAGLKPMIICKKCDDATKIAAKELGVEIIEFSEYYLLLEPEEIESIVKKCMEEIMDEYGLSNYPIIDGETIKFLKIILQSKNFEEAADMLGISEEEMGKRIAELSRKGILPKRSLSFLDLKKCCNNIISRNEIYMKMEKIEKALEEIKDILKNR
ncbi:MAG: YraN family protein [Thermoplasmatales archaeon]|nr:YraN family protein [Thermoplasmatales archaeon]